MVKREEYTSIVHYVAYRGAVSYHRASTILTELGKVLQDAVRLGDNLLIPGIFTIEYQSTKGHIYNNRVYGLENQVKDVVKNLDMSETEVNRIVQLYYKRMKELIEIGCQVNVKGIGYVIPKQDDMGVYCDTRVSPVLDKPEVADFMLMDEDGTLYIEQLYEEDLWFRIELVEGFKVPYQLLRDIHLEIEEVDI